MQQHRLPIEGVLPLAEPHVACQAIGHPGARLRGQQVVQLLVLRSGVVHRAPAQFQLLVEQPGAQAHVNGIRRLQAVAAVGAGEATGHAVGNAVEERVDTGGVVLVAQLLLQPVGGAQVAKQPTAVEARLQLQAAGLLLVELDGVEEQVSVDEVLDLGVVVAQAHIGEAQAGEELGEVVGIAHLPVGAALGLASAINGQAADGAGAVNDGAGGQLLDAGESGGLRVAHKGGAKGGKPRGGAQYRAQGMAGLLFRHFPGLAGCQRFINAIAVDVFRLNFRCWLTCALGVFHDLIRIQLTIGKWILRRIHLSIFYWHNQFVPPITNSIKASKTLSSIRKFLSLFSSSN
ncbi:hypothetical protein D3C85_1070930 [compost metagenome]